MKGDCEECFDRDGIRKFRTLGTSQGKIKTLLADLLEKEEELAEYKNRLKELEAAFYHNLELISERDLELSVLEKQLADENEQLKIVIRERNELEDLIKTIDEKKNRKIQHLETRLSLKEEEIRDLQRENLNNISTLQKIIDDVKQQQKKKLCRMTDKFETQKNELINYYREQIEEKEKYYLLEIDNLAEKLDQARKEKEKLAYAEEEIKDLKYHLQNLEKLFVQKENHYLQEIKKMNKSYLKKVNKEVQCAYSPQLTEKTVQAEPTVTVADSQTAKGESPRQEAEYKERISFLQEQNEVLKFIIKDLKRNRECADQPPGCECLSLRADVEQVNKKFETEISNLKKILERDRETKAEEDAVIRSLETSVTSLKDRLLWELRGRLHQPSGDDIDGNREIRAILLEESLRQQIDALVRAAGRERRKVREKLQEVKRECIDEAEKRLRSKEETKSENLLEKIREEMQKLEKKIERDVRSVLGSGGACATRCYKNAAPRLLGDHCRNDLSAEKWGEGFETRYRGKEHGEQTALKGFPNNLIVGR